MLFRIRRDTSAVRSRTSQSGQSQVSSARRCIGRRNAHVATICAIEYCATKRDLIGKRVNIRNVSACWMQEGSLTHYGELNGSLVRNCVAKCDTRLYCDANVAWIISPFMTIKIINNCTFLFIYFILFDSHNYLIFFFSIATYFLRQSSIIHEKNGFAEVSKILPIWK